VEDNIPPRSRIRTISAPFFARPCGIATLRTSGTSRTSFHNSSSLKISPSLFIQLFRLHPNRCLRAFKALRKDCPRSRTRPSSPERSHRSVQNFRGSPIASPLALRCLTLTTMFSGQGRSLTTQNAPSISGMPISTRVKHPSVHLWHLDCYSIIMTYRWMKL